MLIVWGTRYYFAKDKKTFHSRCPNCGKEVTMKSFTARKFDHLYFIPIVPQGKHRVLSECPKCNWTEWMAYDDWEESYKTDTETFHKLIAQQPDDPQTIITGLALSMRYFEVDLYEQLSATALVAFSDNSEVMQATWLASERFGNTAVAEKSLASCIAAGGEKEAKLAWAKTMLEHNQFDAAKAYALQAIEEGASRAILDIPEISRAVLKSGDPDGAADMIRGLLKTKSSAIEIKSIRKLAYKINRAIPEDKKIDMDITLGMRLSDWSGVLCGLGITACVAFVVLLVML